MKSRKMLALLLAMVMVLGLCSMASAAASTDRVQINNMMVDKSLVDPAMFDADEEAVEEVSAAALMLEQMDAVSPLSLTPNENFPPIQNINVVGYTEDSSVGFMQGQVIYTLTLPTGTTNEAISGKSVIFQLGGASTVSGNIVFTYNGVPYSAAANGTVTIPMTLSVGGTTPFTVAWTTVLNGVETQHTKECRVSIYVPAAISVVVESLTVANEAATLKTLSVGGVTRYLWKAELENATSLTGLTVEVTLESTRASATLGGVSGTKSGNKVTFTNVDMTASKDLVVTCGSLSRTYQVSAHLKGSNITVHIAIRSFLADEWLENRTNWYPSYGTSSVSGNEKTRLLGVASYLRGANSPTTSEVIKNYNGNAPESVESNGRFIFSDISYKTITIPATYTVRDALECFVGLKNNARGERETYFSSFSIQGSDSYIEAMGYYTLKDPTQPDTEENRDYHCIGEFDCGSASGWMYTARTSRTDVTSALPNAGANIWPVSNGMYIDWYYTAAYGMDFGYSMFG